MAKLMRHHALNLVHIISGKNQAGMEKHILPARHKGVDRRVANHHNLHRARIKFGRLDHRLGHIGKKSLGLSVPQNRLCRRRLGQQRGSGKKGKGRAHRMSPLLYHD
jgi:hypothetical protein